jgi:hypothetical protein
MSAKSSVHDRGVVHLAEVRGADVPDLTPDHTTTLNLNLTPLLRTVVELCLSERTFA